MTFRKIQNKIPNFKSTLIDQELTYVSALFQNIIALTIKLEKKDGVDISNFLKHQSDPTAG